MFQWFTIMPKLALTLIIGTLGALTFRYAHLPLPWLLGSIVFTAIASRFDSLPIHRPKILTGPARTVLGITIGSAFTPQVAQGIFTFLPSLLMIIPFIVIIGLAGVWYYWKVIKFDKMTAFFSTMPGGLMEMVSIAEDMGANVAKVTLTQSTRLLLIVFTLPFIIEALGHTHLGDRGAITAPLHDVSNHDLLAMFFLAVIGAWGAKKLHLSGAYILGPMIVSALVYMFGWVEARPPDEAIKLTQLIIGTTIGFVFRGIKSKEVLRTLAQTFGFFLILSLVCGLFIYMVYTFFDFPLVSILLAFSPGGQSEMNLIAIILGVNVPFVALHHVMRIFLVMGIAPLIAKWFKKV
ncbi:MAG: AbrB family transcriptional regulator [Sulfurospirillaceae bacterium]|nr:AbrB family transcriptional regulator [Sulfurospirillaceae bacterium]MDD2827865.1 AbrB family transcriptional regulator [Sulfurospirillaceae bacterium]